ncbi:protein of unknown function [Taphrina deformans PYCC 5710]|uniref:DNA mismatch repair proteins mutS family domain-containing protein n=1 Tax=Taphrina deformans (strain PYCC 5710 / ATCC 11124 / CBS 356.35 / IMI 108563 / JCM 9778 / NBRC 8474) TaxID=1097556 RepID=R4XEA5_TAPDE|nr:protein of unknown function [Taphrina deformans PYCC 5710]|eukprot:CCG84002.1 protein of unknown function [Taphrina deformans PYCC 5710]
MAEMRECASILRRATGRSLVLMDEVGRGTTALDGTAIAYAALLALDRRRASVLFATHFHELVDLLPQSGIGRLCTDMVQDGGQVWFSHRIREGVCRDSHGLQVALLAGIPEDVVQDAKTMQAKLLRDRKVACHSVELCDGT